MPLLHAIPIALRQQQVRYQSNGKKAMSVRMNSPSWPFRIIYGTSACHAKVSPLPPGVLTHCTVKSVWVIVPIQRCPGGFGGLLVGVIVMLPVGGIRASPWAIVTWVLSAGIVAVPVASVFHPQLLRTAAAGLTSNPTLA